MRTTVLFLTYGFLTVASPAQTNAEMKQQAARTYEQADKEMNTAYKKLIGILNDEGRKRLREAQRAWIAYRDAQAGFDSHHFAGGTAEGLERTGSLNLITRERTKRLIADYLRFKDMY